jgi:hypothetical protein
MSNENREKVFSAAQAFLKSPPVIIWGSGATVPLGNPSMTALNVELKEKIDGFNGTDENLEIELGKPEYEKQMPEIREVIWDSVNRADEKVLSRLIDGDASSLDGIKSMVEKFREAHPQVVNIITTNYDCVLEHVMAFHGIPFTDGFEGKELSLFNSRLFQDANITNLVKVHGSLNWFQAGRRIRYLKHQRNSSEPIIICPGKNKYQEAYKTPYRELIQKADDCINNASSFLVVGFGFNDEHLTPKIKEKVDNGTPLVLITKEVSPGCKAELRDAQKYALLQEGDAGMTTVALKNGKAERVEDFTIDGNYWQLDRFMEIL